MTSLTSPQAQRAARPMAGTAELAMPWTVIHATEHHGVYVEDVAGRTVCDLYALDDRGRPRAHRDALVLGPLIAAAPDLLAALSAAQASLDELLDYRGGAEHALADPYVAERAQAALDLASAALRSAGPSRDASITHTSEDTHA